MSIKSTDSEHAGEFDDAWLLRAKKFQCHKDSKMLSQSLISCYICVDVFVIVAFLPKMRACIHVHLTQQALLHGAVRTKTV